jgi:hypothetical protein
MNHIANMKYLIEKVIPHISGMKNHSDSCEMADAVLDFNEYIREPTNSETLMSRELTTQYNCGRSGCLAGWYSMLSAQDERLESYDQSQIMSFSPGSLADHFGITIQEATELFGGTGDGMESYESPDVPGNDYDDDGYSNDLILFARASRAEELLEDMLEAEEEPA